MPSRLQRKYGIKQLFLIGCLHNNRGSTGGLSFALFLAISMGHSEALTYFRSNFKHALGFLGIWHSLFQSPRAHPLTKKPEDSGNEIDLTPLSPVSPEIGCNLPTSRPLRERTDRVLLVVGHNPETISLKKRHY